MTGLAQEPQSSAPGAPAPRKRADWSELGPRIASAIVLMAVALAVTFLGGHPFDLFWLVASLAILWEWQGLVGGTRRFSVVFIGALALAGAAAFAGGGLPGYSILLLAAAAIASASCAAPGKALMSASGVIYAGALVTAVCLLRASFPNGMEAILWLFAVVWGTDVMAFFGGRLIGGPKLAPRFSPSKTWSGFVVGVVSGSLLGWAISPSPACWACMVVLGMLTGAVSQVGDLFESSLKRRSGVKDASGLIPGHGGVMDRLDGFLFAAVFAALLGVGRYGVASAGAGLFMW